MISINSCTGRVCDLAYTTSLFFINKGVEAQKKIVNYTKEKIHRLSSTTLWKKAIYPAVKPLHECYIAPLEKLDYSILAGSLASALLLSSLAALLFGAASLPIAAGAGTLILIGGYQIIRLRVEKKFNREASKEIDQILSCIQKMKDKKTQTQNYKEILRIKENLNNKKYDHLDGSRKELDEQIRTYAKTLFSRSSSLKPLDSQHAKGVIKSHLEAIKNRLLA